MRTIYLVRYRTKELEKILKNSGNTAIIYAKKGDSPYAVRQRVKQVSPDVTTVIVVIT